MDVRNGALGRALNIIDAPALNLEIDAGISERINIGDVIKAQVIEKTSFEILLRMLDGKVFRAAAENGLNVREGEILELLAYEKNEKHTFLKIVRNNTVDKINSPGIEKEIVKALFSALNSAKDGLNHREKIPDITHLLPEQKNAETLKIPDEFFKCNPHVRMPLDLPASFEAAEIRIFPRKNGNSRNKACSGSTLVYLSLNMEYLGHIEAVIKLSGKNVGLNIESDEKYAMDNLKKGRLMLCKRLMDKGYGLIEMKFALKNKGVEISSPVPDENAQNRIESAEKPLDMRI